MEDIKKMPGVTFLEDEDGLVLFYADSRCATPQKRNHAEISNASYASTLRSYNTSVMAGNSKKKRKMDANPEYMVNVSKSEKNVDVQTWIFFTIKYLKP